MSKYSKSSYHEETIRKKDLQIRKLHEELRKRDRPSAHPSTDRSAAPPPTKIQKRLGSRFVHAKIRENEKIADYAFRAIENTELFSELDEVIDDLGRQFEKDFKKIMTPHPFYDAIRGPTLPMSKGAFMACKNFNITKGCPHVLSEETIFHTVNNDPTRIVGHLCMYCLKFLNLVKIHPAFKCEALKALDDIKDTQTSRNDPKDAPKIAPNDNVSDDTKRSFVKELISKLDYVENSVKNLEKRFNQCLDNQNRSRSKFKEYKKTPSSRSSSRSTEPDPSSPKNGKKPISAEFIDSSSSSSRSRSRSRSKSTRSDSRSRSRSTRSNSRSRSRSRSSTCSKKSAKKPEEKQAPSCPDSKNPKINPVPVSDNPKPGTSKSSTIPPKKSTKKMTSGSTTKVEKEDSVEMTLGSSDQEFDFYK